MAPGLLCWGAPSVASSISSSNLIAHSFLWLPIAAAEPSTVAGGEGVGESVASRGRSALSGASHLGHFAQTTSLLPLLSASCRRVVALSLSGHRLSRFDFDDPDYTDRACEPWSPYGQAKTPRRCSPIEVAKRYGDKGVTAVAVHPGVLKTDL